jgi:hypothetical protein
MDIILFLVLGLTFIRHALHHLCRVLLRPLATLVLLDMVHASLLPHRRLLAPLGVKNVSLLPFLVLLLVLLVLLLILLLLVMLLLLLVLLLLLLLLLILLVCTHIWIRGRQIAVLPPAKVGGMRRVRHRGHGVEHTRALHRLHRANSQIQKCGCQGGLAGGGSALERSLLLLLGR